MNYVQAREYLDKHALPPTPQQAVNALLRSIDKGQEAIERYLDAIDGDDIIEITGGLTSLRMLSDVLKEGREAVGA